MQQGRAILLRLREGDRMTNRQAVYAILDDIMDNILEEGNLSLAREAMLRWLCEWTDETIQSELNERGIK